MAINGGIDAFVLQEFRLHAGDTVDEAARIVATFSDGIEPAVPLLRSIDDERDVAIVRALHAGERRNEPEERAALDRLVASWQPIKEYGARISESAERPSSSFRLAVTESGINSPASGPDQVATESGAQPGAATQVGLVWVGEPVGTYAGLMLLLGSYDGPASGRRDPRAWPLPLSRYLRVRIYETPG
jgi:hypothetical protein